MTTQTILLTGTFDTKGDELNYLANCIKSQGGNVLTMDVSVLGNPAAPTDYSKHDVAGAAGHTIESVSASTDENGAMQMMADGAATLTAQLHAQRRFDGVLVLGGTMGTDLALDVCAALPLGVPKYVISTVSFSALIPPHRLAPDIQMILWAGGLYGLNSVCKMSLSQAAGAVLGAARAVEQPPQKRPLIGMTSLGTSALTYMVPLKPALEARGFEVAIFHATGMGGRAFENLASQHAFACVFDFCTQELGNHIHGSRISAGADRLTNAGKAGIPQLVAPGCYDLVDIVGWEEMDPKWQGHISHAHNRLLTSVVLNAEQRREVARAHADQLSQATGKTTFLLPRLGCGEWDRPNADLHDPDGLCAFCTAITAALPANVTLCDIDAHINDPSFATAALSVFDAWLADGTVPTP